MNQLFIALEYVGIFVFALSGSIMAVRKSMDLYGSIILALMTAMGGGLVRDLMLGNIPPQVLQDISYPLVAIAGAVFVYLLYPHLQKFQYPLRILDAVGLAIFTVLGVRMATNYELPMYAIIFSGIISGTGGGMIRDVLAREVPLVLQREIYAMAALVGGGIYAFLLRITPERYTFWVTAGCALLIALLRIFSVYKDWHMPRAFRIRK